MSSSNFTVRPAIDEAALRKSAGDLIAQTFFGPMLKMARDSKLGSQKFEGGRGGQVFQEMLDQRLVQSMSKGVGSKLVDAIVHKFIKSSDSPAGHDLRAAQKLQQQEKYHGSSDTSNRFPAVGRSGTDIRA